MLDIFAQFLYKILDSQLYLLTFNKLLVLGNNKDYFKWRQSVTS